MGRCGRALHVRGCRCKAAVGDRPLRITNLSAKSVSNTLTTCATAHAMATRATRAARTTATSLIPRCSRGGTVVTACRMRCRSCGTDGSKTSACGLSIRTCHGRTETGERRATATSLTLVLASLVFAGPATAHCIACRHLHLHAKRLQCYLEDRRNIHTRVQVSQRARPQV